MIHRMPNKVIASICLTLAFSTYANAQTHVSASMKKDENMTTQARGPFDVKIGQLDAYNKDEGANLARMSIDKQFHGDLEATSKGEMLAAGNGAKGSSGGYVALEKVTGTLHCRGGSFVLQHNATMTSGLPYLNIIVVPDSGTGALAGLSGKMNIIIADGKHSYEFDYNLPEEAAGK
jgi:hypothetical protein